MLSDAELVVPALRALAPSLQSDEGRDEFRAAAGMECLSKIATRHTGECQKPQSTGHMDDCMHAHNFHVMRFMMLMPGPCILLRDLPFCPAPMLFCALTLTLTLTLTRTLTLTIIFTLTLSLTLILTLSLNLTLVLILSLALTLALNLTHPVTGLCQFVHALATLSTWDARCVLRQPGGRGAVREGRDGGRHEERRQQMRAGGQRPRGGTGRGDEDLGLQQQGAHVSWWDVEGRQMTANGYEQCRGCTHQLCSTCGKYTNAMRRADSVSVTDCYSLCTTR